MAFSRPLMYWAMMTGCLDGRGETENSTCGWLAANLGRRDLMKPLEFQLSVSLLDPKKERETERKQGRTSCPWNYPPSRSSGSPSSCIAKRRRRRHSVPLLAPRPREICAKGVSIPGPSRSVLTLLLALSSSSSPSAGEHDLGSRVAAASRKWTPAPVQTRQKNKWVAQNLIRPL